MPRPLKLAALILLVFTAYLGFWPVAIEPQAWQAPIDKGFSGEFAQNRRLESFSRLSLGKFSGPEAAVLGADGAIYASTHQGWIVRWHAADTVAEPWVEVGGRPLGIAFDQIGNLWVANAFLGLQKISPDKNVTLELSEVAGRALRYVDDLDVTSTGQLIVSDASTRFSAKRVGDTLEASLLDLMEHSDNGRVFLFDPVSGESSLLFDELTFANGIAVDHRGEFALVVETGEYRIHRVELVPHKRGESRVIIENLPGFPDNIHRGRDGRFWVGLAAPRSKVVDELADKPFLRKVVQRLPAFLRPQAQAYGAVFAVDGEGQILANLQAPNGEVYTTTGALETSDYLYVTSLTAPFLAKYDKRALRLTGSQ